MPLPVEKPLTLDVAPNIVEDLGFNLYTSLPRVLVEFVANAYDADSPFARISIDLERIHAERRKLREAHAAQAGSGDGEQAVPLELQTLPDDVVIEILDQGHGMSREELDSQFLVVGRRRRAEGNFRSRSRTRVLMGRKGLGKLAGFGVAHHIELTTRKEGEGYASRIVLRYEELRQEGRLNEVKVPCERLDDGGGIDPHGTRIVLSRLVYDPVKSREQTIRNALGEHFGLIDPEDFRITVNGPVVEGPKREYAYAWPRPELAHEELVAHSYKPEEGPEVTFSYRIRFTGEGAHLSAADRGMRIYAHKRLASVPDLLDLGTGIHGFRNTHYLDGVVRADFIDEQPTDYIATDRQTLRWEAPLLAPLREFLTAEMKTACAKYQDHRDEKAKDDVRKDPPTRAVIEGSKLPAHRKRLAYGVAARLASVCEGGLKGDEYMSRLKIFVDGMGQGDILRGIAALASQDRPDLHEVVSKVAALTARELGDFVRYVEGRLDGITALEKLWENVDFKGENNEKELQELFERCPWLLDPTYTQFLTANQAEKTMNRRLARRLEIGEFVPEDYDPAAESEASELGSNRRPDLVILLSNENLRRLVIVELKAPNTSLHNEHLDQLKGYMRRAEEWLREQGGKKAEVNVEGYLIGSKADPEVKAEKVKALRYELEKRAREAPWFVLDIGEVLDKTRDAHRELLDLYERSAAQQEDDQFAT